MTQLTEPDGWFLLRAEHQHTQIIYRGDSHVPLPYAEGSWIVVFQRALTGGHATEGRGRTLEEAWTAARAAVLGVESRRLRDSILRASQR